MTGKKMRMEKLIKTTAGKLILALSGLLVLLCAAIGYMEVTIYEQPKFQDVTVELGTKTIGVDQFTTEYANRNFCRFVGDVSLVDLGKVGTSAVTLAHGDREETVMLTVVDTTAPDVIFHKELEMPAGYIPRALDFVENFSDYSETKVYFAETPVISEDYGDITVSVVAEDAWGNKTRQDCLLTTRWINEEVTLELGVELTKGDILLNLEKDEAFLDQADIDAINAADVGEYTIIANTPETTVECTVKVVDTLGPELKLREVALYPGNSVKAENFVVSCQDASGKAELRLVTEVDTQTLGRQMVTIEAKDKNGNVTIAETALNVTTDLDKPELTGLTEMSVEKHSKPDFLDGVKAMDEVDGECPVTVDETKVNMDKAGTYYLTYTATDKSGNEVTGKRKVTVEHDEEDTAILVEELAARLDSDPEKLRDYVRGNIGYTHSWGGDDPVWHGLKTRGGNCYVHALCLDSLLKYYGYETQLIWVKDKSHYWLLINLEGIGWRHIDPTPSQLHGRYSLMTDQQRYWTLSGRDWDRTAWPQALEIKKEDTEKPVEELTETTPVEEILPTEAPAQETTPSTETTEKK